IVRWTNANGAQSLQLLRERLERAYQATVLGRWSVQCRVYHATSSSTTATVNDLTMNTATPTATATAAAAAAAPTPLYIVQSTAWPKQVHAVMSGRVVVSAGRELEAILVKLRALWTLRQTAVIEGMTYAMGDLLLRAGSITVGQAHRGLVVELEYMACRTPGRCHAALKALLAELLPSNAIWHTVEPDALVATATTTAATATTVHVDEMDMDRYDTRTSPVPQWEALGLSSTLCSSAHTAYQCARLLQQDRLL
ncbi:TATA-binding related factor of subunit 20 of mediator complex-domain-containing protein, partial [Syncephalis pseudoplumigaleata]